MDTLYTFAQLNNLKSSFSTFVGSERQLALYYDHILSFQNIECISALLTSYATEDSSSLKLDNNDSDPPSFKELMKGRKTSGLIYPLNCELTETEKVACKTVLEAIVQFYNSSTSLTKLPSYFTDDAWNLLDAIVPPISFDKYYYGPKGKHILCFECISNELHSNQLSHACVRWTVNSELPKWVKKIPVSVPAVHGGLNVKDSEYQFIHICYAFAVLEKLCLRQYKHVYEKLYNI